MVFLHTPAQTEPPQVVWRQAGMIGAGPSQQFGAPQGVKAQQPESRMTAIIRMILVRAHAVRARDNQPGVRNNRK